MKYKEKKEKNVPNKLSREMRDCNFDHKIVQTARIYLSEVATEFSLCLSASVVRRPPKDSKSARCRESRVPLLPAGPSDSNSSSNSKNYRRTISFVQKIKRLHAHLQWVPRFLLT